MGILLLWPLVSYALFFLFPRDVLKWLIREDGLMETLTAVALLSTAVVFLRLYLSGGRCTPAHPLATHRNGFILCLAVVFFIGAGEEVSWGQRLFNLRTPELMENFNLQKEINIHNLAIFSQHTVDGEAKQGFGRWFTVSRMFSLFWFSYCFLIPAIARAAPRFKASMLQRNFPLVPLWLGLLFVLNYLISKAAEGVIPAGRMHRLTEVKECNFAVLFLVVAVWFVRHSRPAVPLTSRS